MASVLDVLDTLNSDSLYGWKCLAQNDGGFGLFATEKPVFLPFQGPWNIWDKSRIREELNGPFLETIDSRISRKLCSIVYKRSEPCPSSATYLFPYLQKPLIFRRNYNFDLALRDKVILLNSYEAAHFPSYKPHDCDQDLWCEMYLGNCRDLADMHYITCSDGFEFYLEGANPTIKDVTLSWARDRFFSEEWPDWLLLRDSPNFSNKWNTNCLCIPNGIHPVICVDMRTEDDAGTGVDEVDIATFLGDSAVIAGYTVEWKTTILRSKGILSPQEVVVNESEYLELMSAYEKVKQAEADAQIKSIYDEDMPF